MNLNINEYIQGMLLIFTISIFLSVSFKILLILKALSSELNTIEAVISLTCFILVQVFRLTVSLPVHCFTRYKSELTTLSVFSVVAHFISACN